MFSALVCSAGLAHAGTYTVGVGGTGSTDDTCPNCTYIVGNPFGAAGATVVSYTFGGDQSGSITPELFTGVMSGGTITFTEVGTGTTQTVAPGSHTYDFGLVSGTDITSTDTYFGFSNSDGAVVPFNYTSSPVPYGTFLFANGAPLTSEYGTYTYNQINSDGDRNYAIEATALTPEPGSLSLLGTGLAAVAAMVRRRIKQ